MIRLIIRWLIIGLVVLTGLHLYFIGKHNIVATTDNNVSSGITKEHILAEVDNVNCPPESGLTISECKCMVGNMIDKYGVAEANRMLIRVGVDDSDIDPRAIDALRECL